MSALNLPCTSILFLSHRTHFFLPSAKPLLFPSFVSVIASHYYRYRCLHVICWSLIRVEMWKVLIELSARVWMYVCVICDIIIDRWICYTLVEVTLPRRSSWISGFDTFWWMFGMKKAKTAHAAMDTLKLELVKMHHETHLWIRITRLWLGLVNRRGIRDKNSIVWMKLSQLSLWTL